MEIDFGHLPLIEELLHRPYVGILQLHESIPHYAMETTNKESPMLASSKGWISIRFYKDWISVLFVYFYLKGCPSGTDTHWQTEPAR